jgi:endonuclease/exonuclease/phosphatase family metal-dependent hydrolase
VQGLVCAKTTAALEPPSQEERAALLRLPPDRQSHAEAVARHRALFDRLELAPPPAARSLAGPARIAFWNAERGKELDASAALLGGLAADALLLCELDLGMARSGQAHTTRALAERLGTGYAFAVEFLELGLGDAREQAWHAGELNQAGLHGAAILSAVALERPAVIRLETTGDWFDGRHGERRVGGRMAVAATLPIDRTPVTLVSVHFESHGDPVQRASQMRRLIEAIDAYAPAQPVLIGGDLNTSTVSRDWARGTGVKPVLPALRVLDPVRFEPLFEVAAGHGYDWRACNALGVPTQRTRQDGTPTPPLGKIDWFLCRGLAVSDPATVPAVDAQGHAISDHEALVVTIAPDASEKVDPRR